MTIPPVQEELEALEIEQLLDAIYKHYGYDFRHYAVSSMRRRLRHTVRAEGLSTISGLKEKVLHDSRAMEHLLLALSINVSAMFRDPSFYLALRRAVVPHLRTYPFVRIWHAGCSTGEEVYSMAILLLEEGLYERTRLYATDMNEAVLKRAREGIYPLLHMKQYTSNYLNAGGQQAFSDYYTADYDAAIFRPSLRKNIVFAQHNLVTDGPFNEFQVILCRNVMIYFDAVLQEHVHQLFLDSLARRGFLCIGNKETIRHSAVQEQYAELEPHEKIYRRVS